MTRKLFPARFIIQLALCHPTRALIYLTRLDTRLELKCNSFCTPALHHSFCDYIRNDLRCVEINSSHSKTDMTLLALRPLHIKHHDIEKRRQLSHNIEIPRLKNHGIEIPRPKSHDIEFLWNSEPYTP